MDESGLIVELMGLFGALGPSVQFGILAILALVTLCAHIAPYTATKKDDFLIERGGAFLTALKAVFAVVAGNYGKAKNHTKVMEEKAVIKNSK